MKYRPHEYQTRAIEWIKDHKRCCLFLDMGLGKTVSTLTAITELIDEADVNKVLVVAPKKVAESTWATEADKWDHLNGLRVSRVIGTEKQRISALKANADIYVIGRDSVVWLVDMFKTKRPFDCIVVDELTSFKNHTSKRFKALRKWTAVCHRVIGLTGTPVPNGMMDLWAEMYTVDGGERLGKFIGKYRDAYFRSIPIGKVATKYELRRGSEKQILDRIADICLTMRAKDYLTLPKMIEVTDNVALPTSVMNKYNEFERNQVMAYIEEEKSGVVVADGAASLMNKLSQFANGAIYDEDHNVHEVHDEKLFRLDEIIEASNCPVLVFYQFKHDRDRIMSRYKAARAYEGDGDLKDWNDGKIDLLLAHPSSTAYGLNMQNGGHVIVWFGTGWNLELYQQANARLHRQGQQHPVTVYRLICGGTVDDKSLSAIDRKSGTQEGVIESLKELLKKYGNGKTE